MPSLARISLLPLLLVTGAGAADKGSSGSSLAKSSPFNSPTAAAAAPAASETLEFAGVSSIGAKTDLIFYDKTAKKSHWIPLGETKEGISVLAYDARREQVQVRVNGTEKFLPLRKAAPAPGGARSAPVAGFATPMPLPAGAEIVKIQPPPPPSVGAPAMTPAAVPVAPAAAAVPGTPEAQVQQKQETEARMLVSDLLEIGMAQRKAYEEQQRRAAAGGASAATSDAAQQPSPAPTKQ